MLKTLQQISKVQQNISSSNFHSIFLMLLGRCLTPEQKEEFHEFLRHTTDLLSQNVYHTKDNTFKETHKI